MGRGGGGEPRRLGSLCEAGGGVGSSQVLALMAAGYDSPHLARHPLCCCMGGHPDTSIHSPPPKGLTPWSCQGGGK